MNKAEFIGAIAEKAGVTKSEVDIIFSATFDTITQAMMAQDKIVIPGFGTFEAKVRPERKGRNPATGNEMIIPRKNVVNFKAAAQLKQSMNADQQK